MKFSVNNLTTNGEDVIRVNLLCDVTSKDWLILFEDIFNQNPEKEIFRFLIDNRDYADQMNFQGFIELGNLLKKFKIKEFIVGVLASDKGMYDLRNLFIRVSMDQGFNLKCDVFDEEAKVLEWFSQTGLPN